VVIMNVDSDFVLLLERFGPPPQILWVTCGNTSNARLRDILLTSFPEARARLEQGESLVEISDARDKPRQIFRDIYGLLSRPSVEGRTRCHAYDMMRADRPFVEHRNGGQTMAPAQHLRAQGEPHMNGSSDPDFTGKRALA
jgi:hypothetical protein